MNRKVSGNAQKVSEPKSIKGKTSAIASAVLWTLGFVLPFVLPPNSNLSWIADFLLLLGFFPLLWLYPAGWPWLVFGILNVFTGALLEIGYHIPVESVPKALAKTFQASRDMIQSTHPTLVWILTGAVCALFGLFRMTKHMIMFIRNRSTKVQSTPKS